MVQFRRFASFLLGAWLAASVFTDTAAVWNYRAADRFLAAPGLQNLDAIHTLGHEDARVLLRRFAADQNRWTYEQWEWTQLAIGLGLLLTLVFGSRPPILAIGLCLLMLAIVLVNRFGLTAWSGGLSGRPDFDAVQTMIHPRAVYSILEFAKVALGLGIAGLLLLRKPADLQMFAREGEKDEVQRPGGARK